MAVTRSDVLKEIVTDLYPMRDKPTFDSDKVDFHLLSVILLLATRGDLLKATFPLGGAVNPQALHDLGVEARVTKEMLEDLLPYRDAFAAVEIAWLDLSGYTDPPCPRKDVSEKIVAFTKTLPVAP